MNARRRSPEAPAWWNAPGPDYCAFCQHFFQVEVGYHCVECDRPVCPLCIVTLREQHAVVCPECKPREEQI